MRKHNTLKLLKIVKPVFTLICILVVVFAVAVTVLNRVVTEVGSKRIITEAEAESLSDVDCILVLGAGVYSNKYPSLMLQDRLYEGIALYNLGISDRILMSGDNSRISYNEVKVMKDFAIDAGVPSEHIFQDHAGFSTYESMYRARDVFAAKKIIIVTQAYHLYRALYIAEKLGLEAYGVAADPRAYAGQGIREIREILARTKDVFYCLLKPLPTYLGDVMPVNGDGDATD